MTELLIRNVDPSLVERLKMCAKLHHRSLQGELKFIIETAAKMSMAETRRISGGWRKRLAGGTFTDSATLLREDRNR
jgi:plasmid stability protein